jgi:hypothetical protein
MSRKIISIGRVLGSRLSAQHDQMDAIVMEGIFQDCYMGATSGICDVTDDLYNPYLRNIRVTHHVFGLNTNSEVKLCCTTKQMFEKLTQGKKTWIIKAGIITMVEVS